MRIKKIYQSGISLIGIALILGAGMFLNKKLSQREPEVLQMSFQENRKVVQVVPVEYKSREISITATGRVVSGQTVDLIAEVQGELQRGDIPMKKAQGFRAGQVLFRVDNREARLTLSAQKSNFLTSIAAALPDLKVDFPEAYPEWKAYFDNLSVEKTLPETPAIRDAREKVFFSTRNILSQYYSLKSQEERLTKYVVRAPFSGSFLSVTQQSGSVVNPGSRVAVIIPSGSLEIEAPIRAAELKYVKTGMQVEIASESRNKTWKGVVKRVGSNVDPATQSVNIFVSLNSSGREVLDGQYLEVRIPAKRIAEVMEIPRNALPRPGHVFIVEDSLLKVHPIQIEKLNEESLYFTGVKEGASVVVEPLINAFENMPVSPKPAL